MSLKALHIIFITASTLLALGFAGWAVRGYLATGGTADLCYAIGSGLSAIALLVYGKYFLRKLRHISYL
jgi:hypothetical protein